MRRRDWRRAPVTHERRSPPATRARPLIDGHRRRQAPDGARPNRADPRATASAPVDIYCSQRRAAPRTAATPHTVDHALTFSRSNSRSPRHRQCRDHRDSSRPPRADDPGHRIAAPLSAAPHPPEARCRSRRIAIGKPRVR